MQRCRDGPYEPPKVLGSSFVAEPVESGCCLTSCGGSPGGMQSGRHLGSKAAAIHTTLGRSLEALVLEQSKG